MDNNFSLNKKPVATVNYNPMKELSKNPLKENEKNAKLESRKKTLTDAYDRAVDLGIDRKTAREALMGCVFELNDQGRESNSKAAVLENVDQIVKKHFGKYYRPDESNIKKPEDVLKNKIDVLSDNVFRGHKSDFNRFTSAAKGKGFVDYIKNDEMYSAIDGFVAEAKANMNSKLTSEDSSFVGNFVRGATSRPMNDYTTLGMTTGGVPLVGNLNIPMLRGRENLIVDLLERKSKGENLNDLENKALEAWQLKKETETYLEDNGGLTWGEKLGRGAAILPDYIAPMGAINKASKVVGLAAKGNTMLSKLGVSGAEAAVTSLIMPSTGGKGALRLQQNYKTKFDENNDLTVDKIGDVSELEARIKGFTSNVAESFAEKNPLGIIMPKQIGKYLSNPKLANFFAGKLASSAKKINKSFNIDGVAAETGEEFLTNILEPIFTAEPGRIKENFTKDNIIETAVMAGGLSLMMNSPKYLGASIDYAKHKSQAYKYNKQAKGFLNKIDNDEIKKELQDLGKLERPFNETIKKAKDLSNKYKSDNDDNTLFNNMVGYIANVSARDANIGYIQGFQSQKHFKDYLIAKFTEYESNKNQSSQNIDIASDRNGNQYYVLNQQPNIDGKDKFLVRDVEDGKETYIDFKELTLLNSISEIDLEGQWKEEYKNNYPEFAEIVFNDDTKIKYLEQNSDLPNNTIDYLGKDVLLSDGRVGYVSSRNDTVHNSNSDGDYIVKILNENDEIETVELPESKIEGVYNQNDAPVSTEVPVTSKAVETTREKTSTTSPLASKESITINEPQVNSNTENLTINENHEAPSELNKEAVVDYPRDKDGDINYKAIENEDVFIEAMNEDFGEERNGFLDEYISDTEKELKSISKIKDTAKRKRKTIEYNKQIKFLTNVKNKISKEQSSKEKPNEVSNIPLIDKVTDIGNNSIIDSNNITSNNIAPSNVIGDNITEKWKNSKKEIGISDIIFLPNGEKINGNWVLTEANSVTPSHDPHTLNPSIGFPTSDNGGTINDNDYSNKRVTVVEKAQNYDGRAIDNPVIVQDGIVLSGNNRTMSSIIAAEQGTDLEYLKHLNLKAPQKGFTEDQINSYNNPRLVFQVNEESKMPLTTNTFAKFNSRETKAKSPIEKAIVSGKILNETDVRKITSVIDNFDTLQDFYKDSKSQRSIINQMIDSGIINNNDTSELIDEQNNITSSGKTFIESVLLGNVLGEQQLRMLNKPGMKQYRQKIVKTVIPLMQNKPMGDKGILNDINSALTYLDDANSREITLQELYFQTNAFDEANFNGDAALFSILLQKKESDFKKNVLTLKDTLKEETVDLFTNKKNTKQQLYGEIEQQLTDSERQIIDTVRKRNNIVTSKDSDVIDIGNKSGSDNRRNENDDITSSEKENRVNNNLNESKDSNNESMISKELDSNGKLGDNIDVNNRPLIWHSNEVANKNSTENKNSSTIENEYGNNNTIFKKDDYLKNRDLLREKLSQLNSGFDPETLFLGIQVAGYHTESGARKFTDFANRMIDDFGDAILPYLKPLYNAVRDLPESAKYSSEMDDYNTISSIDINQLKSIKNATSTSIHSQRDSKITDAEQRDEAALSDGRNGDRPSGRRNNKTVGTESNRSRENKESDNSPQSNGDAPFSDRTQSDNIIHKQESSNDVTERTPRNIVNRGNDVLHSERETNDVRRGESSNSKSFGKIINGVRIADLEDITNSLPQLYKEQKSDVLFAEKRFFEAEGKGVLFTNGTGTGKTFTGLGIAKRFVTMGSANILFIAPTDAKVNDWIEDARKLDLSITQLNSIKDAGDGLVITTYANFQENKPLQARDFDLVVYDECHYLGQGNNGTADKRFAAHKVVAKLPSYVKNKVKQIFETSRPIKPESKDNIDEYKKQYKAWEERNKAEVLNQTNSVKVLFLSASPFSYHSNLKYADGTLFDIEETITDKEQSGSYNIASGFDKFLVDNFGYRMRYNKLTRPENGVDIDLLEREFNEKMKNNEILSGRKLEVDADYSRKFINIKSEIGEIINKGMTLFYDHSENGFRKKYPQLSELVPKKKWNYLYINQLLESIKTANSIDRINDHINVGRKVVLFHTYKSFVPAHPFHFDVEVLVPDNKDSNITEIRNKRYQVSDEIERFNNEYKELYNLDLGELQNSLELLRSKFGDSLREFNGDVPKSKRNKHISDFNSDNSNVNIIVVQRQAGKEGISLHDQTGKKQRVLIDLGLPIAPTDAIQTEGRIYRLGIKSNAIIEYMCIKTDFELNAYSQKIAERVRTPENLAMGNQARDLETSFKEGYINSVDTLASEEIGVGGKEIDTKINAISDFNRAKTFYYANQKKTSKTKEQDGIDYFATPEPIGFKMVEWLGLKPNESALEPSAGHGAIARFFNSETNNTFIEPSYKLSTSLKMNSKGDVQQIPFEELNIVNKYDGIAMNPPFGSSGKTAMDHLKKAFNHLRENGRLIAIIPKGASMDKRLNEFFYGVNEKGKLVNPNAHLVAEIELPSCTFSRAGTSVNTTIVIIDKISDSTIAANITTQKISLSSSENINNLFDRIENITISPRQGSLTQTTPKGDNSVSFVGSDKFNVIEKIIHTQTGKPIFSVKPKEYLGDKFNDYSSKSKKYNGYYSRFAKGFLFDKQEDAESFYNYTVNEDSKILFRDKKDHSSLGDAINEIPLSDHDSKDEGASFSVSSNSKNTANLKNNSEITIRKVKKAINIGIDNTPVKPQKAIQNIAKTLGLLNNGSSYYNEFSTPKGTMTIRLSHHKANGDNFSKNSSDNNISIVIERYVKDANPSVNSYSEYVYSEKTLEDNPKLVIESVLTGVYNVIETGVFNDNSGLAKVTHYNEKKPSIYGGTIHENLDDGSVTKSESVPNSNADRTKNNANLIKETQYTKKNIQKKLNSGISEYKKEQNEINRLADVIRLRYKGGSYYSEFMTPKGTMTFRLSHHKANGDNFKRNNSEKNISIVIEKYNTNPKSSDVIYSEYIYPISSIGKNSNNVIENILKSVNTALDTGEYIDNSGLAEVTHYNEKTIFRNSTQKYGNTSSVNSRLNEKYTSPFEQRKEELEPRKIDKNSIVNTLTQLSAEFNTPVNIVSNVLKLPLDLQDKIKKAYSPNGFYDTKSDSVWFITGNIPTDSEAQKTFLHEVVAHKGLRGLLKNNFNGFLDSVYNSLGKEQQDAIKKEHPGKSNRVCTEEYIATIAEGNISVPLWKKIVASIRDFFRTKLNMPIKISDNDIRLMLLKSENRLKQFNSLKDLNTIAEEYTLSKVKNKSNSFEEMKATSNTIELINTMSDNQDILFKEKRKRAKKNDLTLEHDKIFVQKADINAEKSITKKTKKQTERAIEVIEKTSMDSGLAIKKMQQRLERMGVTINETNDVYRNMDKWRSRAQANTERFMNHFMNPLIDKVADIEKKYGVSKMETDNYLLAKHGIEKESKGIMAFSSDENSEWTLDIANEIIDSYERKVPKEDLGKLWELTNNATSEILRIGVNSGRISLNTVKEIQKNGYKYYVPSRGWEDNAKEIGIDNDYVHGTFRETSDSNRNVAIIQAKGRTSKPFNAISNIMKMAEGEILLGERNIFYQKLYNLARADEQNNWLSVKEQWFAKDDNGNEILLDREPTKEEVEEYLRIKTEIKKTTSLLDNKIKEFKKTPNSKKLEDEIIQITEDLKELKDSQNIKRHSRNITIQNVSDIKSKADLEKSEIQHRIVLMVDGMSYQIIMKDEAIRNAIAETNLKEWNWKWGRKYIGGTTRGLSKMFTQKNPAFIVSNLVKDFEYALEYNLVDKNGNAVTFSKYTPLAIGTCFRNVSSKLQVLNVNEIDGLDIYNIDDRKKIIKKYGEKRILDTLYNIFKLQGGETGYMQTFNLEDYAEKYEKEIHRRMKGENPLAKGWRGLNKGLDAMADVSENSIRFATFVAHLENGNSVFESVDYAKNITVNFNRKGSHTGWFSPIYSFINAQMRGVANDLNLFKGNKKRFAIKVSILITKAIVTSWIKDLLLEGLRDDDDQELDISEHSSYVNQILYFGDKYIFTIPLPHADVPWHVMGTMMYNYFAGKKTASEAYLTSISALSEYSFPFTASNNDLIRGFVPTAIVPFYDIYLAKENAFGYPISKPKYNKNDETPAEHTYSLHDVNSILYNTAVKLNELGGGNDKFSAALRKDGTTSTFKKIIFDWNPSPVQHSIEYYTGGVGKTTVQLGELIYDAFTDNDSIEVKNIPVVNRFVKELYPKDASKIYYTNSKNVINSFKVYKDYIKQGSYKKDWASSQQEFNEDYYKINRLYKTLENSSKLIDNYRDKMYEYKKGENKYDEYKVLIRKEMIKFNNTVDELKIAE